MPSFARHPARMLAVAALLLAGAPVVHADTPTAAAPSQVPAPEGAYRLLSVHLYESLSGEKSPVQRVYLAEGQIWAE